MNVKVNARSLIRVMFGLCLINWDVNKNRIYWDTIRIGGKHVKQ